MIRAAIALLLTTSPAAAADVKCFDRATLIATLADQFGEVQILRALEHRGEMVEAYVSATGTWTLVVVKPNLATCIVATGTNWMMIAPGIEG